MLRKLEYSERLTLSNQVQPLNALAPISVMLFGNANLYDKAQSQKAPFPIFSNLSHSEKSTFTKFTQPPKAFAPMLVMFLGIFISSNDL